MNEDFNEQCLQETPVIEQPEPVLEYVEQNKSITAMVANVDLVDTAVRIATKIIKPSEGCVLTSYPDPASDLSKALSANNLLHKYLEGNYVLPENFEELSGAPWTIGFGATEGVTAGMKWTQERADADLQTRIKKRAAAVLAACPELAKHNAEKLAACTSFADNEGVTTFKNSSIAKNIAAKNFIAAGQSFAQYNIAKGNVMQGLTVRRKLESDLFNSVKE